MTQNFPPGTVRPLSPLCLHNEKSCPLSHPEEIKWGQTFKINLYPTVQAAQGGRQQTQRSSDSHQRMSFIFPRALFGVIISDTASHSTTGGAQRLSVPGSVPGMWKFPAQSPISSTRIKTLLGPTKMPAEISLSLRHFAPPAVTLAVGVGRSTSWGKSMEPYDLRPFLLGGR